MNQPTFISLFFRRLRHQRSSRALAQMALTCLLTLGANLPVFAQEPDDVVRVDTALVQLNVGVVDARGQAIRSLSQNDFTIYENGVKQPILNFEPTQAPFSLVLLLDMSGSTINFRPQLKQAVGRFLDALSPEDRVAVVQFNRKVKKLSGFTNDMRKTEYAIRIAEGAGETYLYDALRYAMQELDKEGKRRKAVVVLTDGLDTQMRIADREKASKAETEEAAVASIDPKASSELNSILSEADKQGVTVYPLALPSGDPKRIALPTPVQTAIYAAARVRLQSIADRTGGRLNDIQRLDQMAQLYALVAADLRSLYSVAYRGAPGRDGKWREIRIEVAQPELLARTRPGYFAR